MTPPLRRLFQETSLDSFCDEPQKIVILRDTASVDQALKVGCKLGTLQRVLCCCPPLWEFRDHHCMPLRNACLPHGDLVCAVGCLCYGFDLIRQPAGRV